MTRRALITGGAGFIGSHVAEALVADGIAVDVLDDLSTGKRENVPDGATFHRMDIRSPAAAELLREIDFDAVIHLAAQMDVRRSVADPIHDADVNVRGTLNLLEALRLRESRARIVFASSGGAVYGDHTTPPNSESTGKEPDSPYAVTKLAAEYYLAYYSRIHGLDTVTLRFANVYGPRQDPHGEAGVVAIFCGRMIEGRPLTVYGDGSQTRDYVFVADVVAAVRRAMDVVLPPPRGIDARAFNVGTGVATSVIELASALREVAGAEVPLEFAPNRRGEQQASFVNVDRARASLGWSPRVSLQRGLAETYAWFAARARPAAKSAS